MDWDEIEYNQIHNYRVGEEVNRKDWEFEYTAKELADAALTKRNYRETRVEWWEQKKNE